MDEEQKKDWFKLKILDKLNDLKEKIEEDEPCPDMEQSVDMLCDISDKLDECLNFWYY